jgi:hypothetical protein
MRGCLALLGISVGDWGFFADDLDDDRGVDDGHLYGDLPAGEQRINERTKYRTRVGSDMAEQGQPNGGDDAVKLLTTFTVRPCSAPCFHGARRTPPISSVLE